MSGITLILIAIDYQCDNYGEADAGILMISIIDAISFT